MCDASSCGGSEAMTDALVNEQIKVIDELEERIAGWERENLHASVEKIPA
jgi:hypothetical protein